MHIMYTYFVHMPLELCTKCTQYVYCAYRIMSTNLFRHANKKRAEKRRHSDKVDKVLVDISTPGRKKAKQMAVDDDDDVVFDADGDALPALFPPSEDEDDDDIKDADKPESDTDDAKGTHFHYHARTL
jgi:hypothetical protein